MEPRPRMLKPLGEEEEAGATVTWYSVEWERLPLLARIMIVYVAAGTVGSTMTVRVETPEPPSIVSVLRWAVGPGGETVTVKFTAPVKP